MEQPDQDNQDDVHVPPLPTLVFLPRTSFLSLPDAVHIDIASFLPGRDTLRSSRRLRVSEVSRALLEPYGTTLTRVRIRYQENKSVGRLAALLRRQRALTEVLVDRQECIPALCQAVVQGCCRRIKTLRLTLRNERLTWERGNLLAGALEVDGALPALRTLHIDCPLNTGALVELAGVLKGATLPLLEELRFDSTDADDNDWNAVAEMLETCAGNPECERLERVEGKDPSWFPWRVPVATRVQLLRALLLSVKELPGLQWEQAFEACFCERERPFVTSIDLTLNDENAADMTVFSAATLASMPSLETLKLNADTGLSLSARAFNSITAALRNGALQALQALELEHCILGRDDITDFADALENSAYAQRLVSLSFHDCQVDGEGLQALMNPLGRGALPDLKKLCFGRNPGITDVGIGALTEALRAATQTYLWSLDLSNVGMEDAGMEELAFLVRRGRLAQLMELLIAANDGATDRGIDALVGEINNHGLPALKVLNIGSLKEATAEGIGALVNAVLNGSPELATISLSSYPEGGANHSDMIRGMLQATGRDGSVTVVPPPPPFVLPPEVAAALDQMLAFD